jgi:hypothetical protein
MKSLFNQNYSLCIDGKRQLICAQELAEIMSDGGTTGYNALCR